MARRPHFLEPWLDTDATAALVVEGREPPLAQRIEAATDSAARRRGLLGRTGLAEGVAFVIAPSSAIHTFFMRFAIDLVFAARDGRVLKVRSRVGPWRLSAAFGAFAVIEMAAGSVERAGVRAGDRLRVRAS